MDRVKLLFLLLAICLITSMLIKAFTSIISPSAFQNGLDHRIFHALWSKKRCNIFGPSEIRNTFLKAKLTYSRGSAVCYVHGNFDFVSNSILTKNTWEPSIVSQMETLFDIDPSLGLIDLGCNVGVYTITAAMRGRKVVSVDVNIENLKRVRKSLLENNAADRVTLLFNGISDR